MGKYILEGSFVIFDKVNRGGPIYSESDYLPHLKKLRSNLRRKTIKKIYESIEI